MKYQRPGIKIHHPHLTLRSQNQEEEFEQKPTKNTKGYWFRFAKNTLHPYILPEPATSGVLAACGLRGLRGLLFKLFSCPNHDHNSIDSRVGVWSARRLKKLEIFLPNGPLRERMAALEELLTKTGGKIHHPSSTARDAKSQRRQTKKRECCGILNSGVPE